MVDDLSKLYLVRSLTEHEGDEEQEARVQFHS